MFINSHCLRWTSIPLGPQPRGDALLAKDAKKAAEFCKEIDTRLPRPIAHTVSVEYTDKGRRWIKDYSSGKIYIGRMRFMLATL